MRDHLPVQTTTYTILGTMNEKHVKTLMCTVKEYIKHGEPVGSEQLHSKTLSQFSPASIRNYLKFLETDGFLTQPHTSAGRVPTDKAYRFYVNSLENSTLSTVKESQIKVAIDGIKNGSNQINYQCVEVLDTILNHANFVITHETVNQKVTNLQLVKINENNLLSLFMNKKDISLECFLNFKVQEPQESLNTISNCINTIFNGSSLYSFNETLFKKAANLMPNYASLILNISKGINSFVNTCAQSQLFICKGFSKLLSHKEFSDVAIAKKVIQGLEDKDYFIDLYKQNQSQSLAVVIGEELNNDYLESCSVILSPLSINDTPVGTLGTLGPKRMAYSQLLPIMNLTAQTIQKEIS